MTGRRRTLYMTVVIIGLMLVALAGCGKGGNTFQLSRLGFSMKLPPGWQQGEPGIMGGFKPRAGGEFFFADPELDDPHGNVMDFPLMEGESLAEYVDNLISETEKMEQMQAGLLRVLGEVAGVEQSEEIKEAEKQLQTKVLSKTPRTISKHEAIEVLTEAPFTLLTVYILKGDTVIWVTFRAPKEEFPQYEQLFRDAIETIKIR
ncbi:MAG: hypothetical protein AMS15_06370 [Planctomycetes bacterium DG_23]|nr:MAG: hypothetical protein AMS15_06370 [Planctomycetes bacterium DG_23]